jgi:hypothetical protein
MIMDNHVRQEYLNKHLPYRINSLLSPDLIEHRRNTSSSSDLKNKCFSDSLILEPSFEISIIFGRSLLQFLEIGYSNSTNSLIDYKPKPDDYTIRSLYPNLNVKPINDTIVSTNYQNLCVVSKIANKSVAHLTSKESNPGEHELLKPGRMAIYKLMLKYIPHINKVSSTDKIGIWWFEQVENL